MNEVNKHDFYLLLEIRQFKKKLGIADHPNSIEDLKAERNRLRKLVKICYE